MARSLRYLPLIFVALTASIATVGTGSARADSAATSTNWAGYAATKNGIRFRRVAGTWTQPAVSCTAGPGFSANWVGLGGYHQTSTALEQIGTEADCTASGKASYSAWYELVPDTSKAIKMTVRAGDTLSASVAVRGHTVQLRLANRTRGTVFEKTLSAPSVDTRSAEWIVEAPALCSGNGGGCRATPLANFGTTGFTAATATTTGGHTGPVVDPTWSRAAITLSPSGGREFAGAAPVATSGSAAPSPLSANGNGFLVVFQPAASPAELPPGAQ